MAYKKVVRQVAKKVGRAVKRRYFKGKGYSNPKIGTMIRDVALLKRMVNAEKKRLEVKSPDGTSYPIGQVSGNTSGHFLADFTPNPGQGVGYNQKTGNSIKWVSSYLDFQFVSQSACISGMRMKIQLVKVVGQPFSTVSDVMGKFIEPTAFLTGGTVYDINSPRDPDYFKNYKVLATKYVTIKNDDITSEQTYKRVSMGLKLKNHHVRNNDNDPTNSMGQVFLLITADQGNGSITTASTINGVPQSAINTGCFMRFEWTHYYYDN